MSLKAFYDGLYEYEKTLDTETIEALAQCVLRNLTRDELRSTVREKVFEKTLDIGCGIGYNLIVLLENAKINHLVGIDVASGAVRIAKKRIAKLGTANKNDFVICDAQLLPFKESAFDLVVCTEVLEHLSDDEKGVSEISRVAKVDGKVFLSVPSAKNSLRKHVTKMSAKTVHTQSEVIDRGYFGLQSGGDLRNYQMGEVVELLNARGLRIIRHWFNYRFFFSLSVRLNSSFLRLGQRLLKIGGAREDFVREGVSSHNNTKTIRRLLRLYSRIVIPASNALLSLDLVFLRFDYGGNLTIEAGLLSEIDRSTLS